MYIGANKGEGIGLKSFWNQKRNTGLVFRALSFKHFSEIKRYFHISDLYLQPGQSEWFDKLEPLSIML